MAEEISHDVVWEILTRLPATTLVRFRSVCKSWNALISSNSQFIRSHLHFSRNSSLNYPKVIIFNRSSTLYYSLRNFSVDCNKFELRLVNNDNVVVTTENRSVHVLCSTDGLILLRYSLDTPNTTFDQPIDQGLILWNPVTGDYNLFVAHYSRSLVVAFGVCYDSLSGQCKVVLVSRTPNLHPGRGRYILKPRSGSDVMIYDVSDQSWVTVVQPRYPILDKMRCHWLVVPANGMLHCVSVSTSDNSLVVVYFDLLAAEFKEVPLPPQLYEIQQGRFLGLELWKGQLCVHCFTKPNQLMQIWVMNEYGNGDSWTNLVAIQIKPSCCLKFLAFTDKDELVLQVEDGVLVIHNPSDGLFKTTPTDNSVARVWTAINYVESLVSPHGNKDPAAVNKPYLATLFDLES